MRTILIQATTDRGTETRISTRKQEMDITIYFKADGIKRAYLTLDVFNGQLRISGDLETPVLLAGEPASQLSYK